MCYLLKKRCKGRHFILNDKLLWGFIFPMRHLLKALRLIKSAHTDCPIREKSSQRPPVMTAVKRGTCLFNI